MKSPNLTTVSDFVLSFLMESCLSLHGMATHLQPSTLFEPYQLLLCKDIETSVKTREHGS
jgi:hypothetical protein